MTNISIRQAKPEDVQQLSELMYQYMDFYKRPRQEEGKLRGFIEYILDNRSSGIQFVAEREGALTGFATLYFTFSTLQLKRAAIMNDLFVTAEARGQRVGEGLFQACLEYAKRHDYAYMTWETAQDNGAAQAFYHKMGGRRSDWIVYEMSW